MELLYIQVLCYRKVFWVDVITGGGHSHCVRGDAGRAGEQQSAGTVFKSCVRYAHVMCHHPAQHEGHHPEPHLCCHGRPIFSPSTLSIAFVFQLSLCLAHAM